MERIIWDCWLDRNGFICLICILGCGSFVLFPKFWNMTRKKAILGFIAALCALVFISIPYIKDAHYQDVVVEDVEAVDIYIKNTKGDTRRVYVVNGPSGKVRLIVPKKYKEYAPKVGKFYTVKYLKYSKSLLYSKELTD